MKKIQTIFIILFSILIVNDAYSQTHGRQKQLKTDRFGALQLPEIEIETETETPYNDVYLYAFPPYPIPAKEIVNTLVYWDKRYDFNKAETNAYNTEGIKICCKERFSISQQSDWSSIVSWNSTGYPLGIYILTIKHGSKTISIKVIIE